MKKSLTIIFVFLIVALHGQKSTYLKYLIQPDSNGKAYFFNFRAQYLYVTPDKPFRRGGMTFNFAFNLARFFSKKFILGITCDTRFAFAGQIRQHFSFPFIEDFNNNFIPTQSTLKDSATADVLYRAINNEGIIIKGNHPLYFGVCFSPFPQKYGGFIIEFKRGGSSYPFYGDYDGKAINDNGENSPAMLITKNNYSFDLSFVPYLFFRSGRPHPFNSKLRDFHKFIVVTLTYEKFSLKNSTFNGRPLSNMVTQDFIARYSDKYYFGIKVGIGIN